MFEQSSLTNTHRSWWTTCAGFAAETAGVAVLVLCPLIWPQALPRTAYFTSLAAPGPPPAPVRKGTAERPRHRAAVLTRAVTGGLFAPTAMPAHAVQIIDTPPEIGGSGVPGGIEGVAVQGILGGVAGGIPMDLSPPAIERIPEPVRAPAPVAPLSIPRYTVGGNVHLAEPIFRPDPTYPPLARTARIAGTVELIAIIGTDGRIKELRVSRGHPLLVQAAIDAVRRWIYRPTTLNGVPVEVVAPITVNFKLN